MNKELKGKSKLTQEEKESLNKAYDEYRESLYKEYDENLKDIKNKDKEYEDDEAIINEEAEKMN